MSFVSKVNLPDGNTYDIADKTIGISSTVTNENWSFNISRDGEGALPDTTHVQTKIGATNVTLLKTAWVSSDGAYTQDVTVSGLTADSVVWFTLSPAATAAEIDAAAKAKVRATAQATNTLTVTASSVPTESIPVVINIG